jgi:hypothetical protein
MVDIKSASLDEATRGPAQSSGFWAAFGGPQFIVAQIFTILATVIGVYLAGYVGFQRTLEYDRYTQAQRQANLIQALHAELQDNTARLRAFVPLLEKTQEGEPVYGEWPRLHLFVWQASAQNSALFDAPPQSITDMQIFYEEMSGILGDSAVRDAFRHLTSSNIADRRTVTEQIDKLIKRAETALLPALKKSAAAAETTVRDYDKVGR